MDVLVFSIISEYCDIPSLVMLGMTCRQAESVVIAHGKHLFKAVSAIHNATDRRCLYIVSDHVEYTTSVAFVDGLFISDAGYAYHESPKLAISHFSYQSSECLPKYLSIDTIIAESDTKRIVISPIDGAVGEVGVLVMAKNRLYSGVLPGRIIMTKKRLQYL